MDMKMQTHITPLCSSCSKPLGGGAHQTEGIIVQGGVFAASVNPETRRPDKGLIGHGDWFKLLDFKLANAEPAAFCFTCFAKLCFPKTLEQIERDRSDAASALHDESHRRSW